MQLTSSNHFPTTLPTVPTTMEEEYSPTTPNSNTDDPQTNLPLSSSRSTLPMLTIVITLLSIVAIILFFDYGFPQQFSLLFAIDSKSRGLSPHPNSNTSLLTTIANSSNQTFSAPPSSLPTNCRFFLFFVFLRKLTYHQKAPSSFCTV